MGLDILGLVPVIGNAADLVNFSWYMAEGRPALAAMSLLAMVPVAGQVSTAAKMGQAWTKIFNRSKYAEKVARNAKRFPPTGPMKTKAMQDIHKIIGDMQVAMGISRTPGVRTLTRNSILKTAVGKFDPSDADEQAKLSEVVDLASDMAGDPRDPKTLEALARVTEEVGPNYNYRFLDWRDVTTASKKTVERLWGKRSKDPLLKIAGIGAAGGAAAYALGKPTSKPAEKPDLDPPAGSEAEKPKADQAQQMTLPGTEAEPGAQQMTLPGMEADPEKTEQLDMGKILQTMFKEDPEGTKAEIMKNLYGMMSGKGK